MADRQPEVSGSTNDDMLSEILRILLNILTGQQVDDASFQSVDTDNEEADIDDEETDADALVPLQPAQIDDQLGELSTLFKNWLEEAEGNSGNLLRAFSRLNAEDAARQSSIQAFFAGEFDAMHLTAVQKQTLFQLLQSSLWEKAPGVFIELLGDYILHAAITLDYPVEKFVALVHDNENQLMQIGGPREAPRDVPLVWAVRLNATDHALNLLNEVDTVADLEEATAALSAFHLAALHKNVVLMQALVKKGADIYRAAEFFDHPVTAIHLIVISKTLAATGGRYLPKIFLLSDDADAPELDIAEVRDLIATADPGERYAISENRLILMDGEQDQADPSFVSPVFFLSAVSTAKAIEACFPGILAQTDVEGRTVFHFAGSGDSVKSVELGVIEYVHEQYGDLIERLDERNCTPAHLLVRGQDVDAFTWTAKNGFFGFDVQDKENRPAFFYGKYKAVIRKCFELMLEQLVEHEPEITIEQVIEALETWLAHKDHRKQTVLQYAARKGHGVMASMLLHGFAINLHLSDGKEHSIVVQDRLFYRGKQSQKPKGRSKKYYKKTVRLAVESHRRGALYALLGLEDECIGLTKQAPLIPLDFELDGATLLYWCAHHGNRTRVKTLSALLKEQPDQAELLNRQSYGEEHQGRTALLAALATGHTRSAKALLQAGADPFISDRSGQHSLHYIARSAHNSVHKFFKKIIEASEGGSSAVMIPRDKLLLHFSDLDLLGYTPLMLAVRRGREFAVTLFLSHLAPDDFMCRGRQGATVLHFSTIFGYAKILRQLLDFITAHQAEHSDILGMIGYENMQGKTAYEIAVESDYRECAELLSEFSEIARTVYVGNDDLDDTAPLKDDLFNELAAEKIEVDVGLDEAMRQLEVSLQTFGDKPHLAPADWEMLRGDVDRVIVVRETQSVKAREILDIVNTMTREGQGSASELSTVTSQLIDRVLRTELENIAASERKRIINSNVLLQSCYRSISSALTCLFLEAFVRKPGNLSVNSSTSGVVSGVKKVVQLALSAVPFGGIVSKILDYSVEAYNAYQKYKAHQGIQSTVYKIGDLPRLIDIAEMVAVRVTGMFQHMFELLQHHDDKEMAKIFTRQFSTFVVGPIMKYFAGSGVVSMDSSVLADNAIASIFDEKFSPNLLDKAKDSFKDWIGEQLSPFVSKGEKSAETRKRKLLGKKLKAKFSQRRETRVQRFARKAIGILNDYDLPQNTANKSGAFRALQNLTGLNEIVNDIAVKAGYDSDPFSVPELSGVISVIKGVYSAKLFMSGAMIEYVIKRTGVRVDEDFFIPSEMQAGDVISFRVGDVHHLAKLPSYEKLTEPPSEVCYVPTERALYSLSVESQPALFAQKEELQRQLDQRQFDGIERNARSTLELQHALISRQEADARRRIYKLAYKGADAWLSSTGRPISPKPHEDPDDTSLYLVFEVMFDSSHHFDGVATEQFIQQVKKAFCDHQWISGVRSHLHEPLERFVIQVIPHDAFADALAEEAREYWLDARQIIGLEQKVAVLSASTSEGFTPTDAMNRYRLWRREDSLKVVGPASILREEQEAGVSAGGSSDLPTYSHSGVSGSDSGSS